MTDINAGTKFDAGKRRMSLVPLKALWAVMDVLEYGAKKYTRVVSSEPKHALNILCTTCNCFNAVIVRVPDDEQPTWENVEAALRQHKPMCEVRTLSVVQDALERTGAGNWRRVPHARTRYYDACIRHLTAWWEGETHDSESGLHHLGHAGCCVLFLLALELEGSSK